MLLQCLYIYILDLQSQIRGSIATGPAKCRDKRENCYRTSTNVSHSESEIRVSTAIEWKQDRD